MTTTPISGTRSVSATDRRKFQSLTPNTTRSKPNPTPSLRHCTSFPRGRSPSCIDYPRFYLWEQTPRSFPACFICGKRGSLPAPVKDRCPFFFPRLGSLGIQGPWFANGWVFPPTSYRSGMWMFGVFWAEGCGVYGV